MTTTVIVPMSLGAVDHFTQRSDTDTIAQSMAGYIDDDIIDPEFCATVTDEWLAKMLGRAVEQFNAERWSDCWNRIEQILDALAVDVYRDNDPGIVIMNIYNSLVQNFGIEDWDKGGYGFAYSNAGSMDVETLIYVSGNGQDYSLSPTGIERLDSYVRAHRSGFIVLGTYSDVRECIEHLVGGD